MAGALAVLEQNQEKTGITPPPHLLTSVWAPPDSSERLQARCIPVGCPKGFQKRCDWPSGTFAIKLPEAAQCLDYHKIASNNARLRIKWCGTRIGDSGASEWEIGPSRTYRRTLLLFS